MHWVVIVGVGWLLLAVTGAVVVGRSIRIAEHHEAGSAVAGARRRPRACLAPVDRAPASWESETT
ncbi:hypothetical protein ACI78V_02560 [Geodermatophilus sp. SYSU D00742]